MANLEELRQTQKARFAAKLKEITCSTMFKEMTKKMELQKYKFVVISKPYIRQLIDVACYSYSFLGAGVIGKIFQLSIQDRYNEWGTLKANHLLKTGLLFIAVDENNLVAGSAGFYDLFDNKYQTDNNAKTSAKLQHKKECTEHAALAYCKQNKEFKKIYKNEVDQKELCLYYGKWCEGTLFCARPDVQKTGLMYLMSRILWILMVECGYKFVVSRVSNSRTSTLYKHQNKNVFGPHTVYQFKLYDHTFNDGIKMKKYFDELVYKWKYTPTQVEKLKQIYYTLTISKLNPFQTWKYENVLKFVLQSFINHKENKKHKNQSKL